MQTQQNPKQVESWYSTLHWTCRPCGKEYNSTKEPCWCMPEPVEGCHKCKTADELRVLQDGASRKSVSEFYRDERWKLVPASSEELEKVAKDEAKAMAQKEEIPNAESKEEREKRAEIARVMREKFPAIRKRPDNSTCFDCNAKQPTWALLQFGVFVCVQCAMLHRNRGRLVFSTTLDTKNWTVKRIKIMEVGGHERASAFFKSHNIPRDKVYECSEGAEYAGILLKDALLTC